ncbi:MAG: bifunctional diaminohydroxyphosphoribosylaminopyrimidine deaminase/5-amino-6-(5-phosphoribosylamino)uracil reductase RibD [Thermoanaerobaculia bacterium]
MTAVWDRLFALAEQGRFSASPNPMVGAVLVGADGEPVGEGFHERAGLPHAEAAALALAGTKARNATLYVNLEPCAHQGRTPACAEALARAGVSRVVCSIEDPDPRTAGAGIRHLRERGIAVEVGAEAVRAERLNEAFLVSVREGRPFVELKWAASLDGKIATSTGASRWISSEEARQDSMRLREERDAILVGAGTVLADDPLLTRRLGLSSSIVPHRRVVLDGRLRVSPEARIFRSTGEGEVWLVTARPVDDPALDAFRARGVLIESLPMPDQRIDLPALLRRLADGETRSLLVEGGGGAAWSFVEQGLVDRVTCYLAPKLVGGANAPTPLSGTGFPSLEAVPVLHEPEHTRLGGDLKISGRLLTGAAGPSR